ncbi:fatty acid desaturase [Altericroceibacterium spongiae]|uniref:Fatty acid desaturase n=1 Tax=Altericroceibacterium spongiae TaxID=2320269 RepID=A0A420ERR8_9SPHN|nr:fatty acid desaturase [Altericroceibacterium spongiae]RKF23330.1 fatty acid desaturase [Altericroceibacterium spongiae]
MDTLLNTKPMTKVTATVPLSKITDDRDMLRMAAKLTRDLSTPNPVIYWTDFLGSAAIGYAALAGAILVSSPWLAVACAILSVLALYRATLFIHEITHLDHSRLPHFRLGWNLVIGAPMMLPSFMYEGIHMIHHTRTRYGTVEDPEYLPLALMKPWSLPLFLLTAILMPVGLLLRFGILGPLSMFSPRLRRLVVGRFSGLQINPRFERRDPEGDFAKQWRWQELGASCVAIALIVTTLTGILPLKAFLIYMGVISGVAVINQLRTLAAHLWENEGETLNITAQYLDSVNVPDGFLPYLWAPVGLRYHALHHLLPRLPYHSLGEAHRRISGALTQDSVYETASYPSLRAVIARLAVNTMRKPRR